MKRNMNLIRDILLFMDWEITLAKKYGYTLEQVYAHYRLASQGGLVDEVGTVTRKGREFLELVRDDHVWNVLKRILEERGGLPFDVLKELAANLQEEEEE